MAEEIKTGNPMIKYLTVGILGVIALALVTLISYFVATMVYKSQSKQIVKEVRVPEKAKMDLDEFLVPTADNNGIIKAKIQLGLSDEKMPEIINKHLGLIRDSINKILVSKTPMQAINDYRSGKLNQEIQLELNKVLKPYLGNGVFDGKVKKVVAVYFIDFLVQ